MYSEDVHVHKAGKSARIGSTARADLSRNEQRAMAPCRDEWSSPGSALPAGEGMYRPAHYRTSPPYCGAVFSMVLCIHPQGAVSPI
jgi:hypothetical protein